MKQTQKLLMRMAGAIHEQITPERNVTANIELPSAAWQSCETLIRRMRRASHHGWQLAARRLERNLRQAIGRLHEELTTTYRQLDGTPNELSHSSIRDIYADLVTLQVEFDEVSLDRRVQTVSVTTEPISLEGVYLGPFEIRLDWSDLATGHPHNYRVIAEDANPAAANDGVTHPHVQDEAVCEGDGHQSIRKALEQGRLLDFFVIIANLLRTYNSDSPYVSLSDWYGVECADCGEMVSDDERWSCEKCDVIICGGCYTSCPDCDGIFCNECVTRCEDCGDIYCNRCVKSGSRCRNCLENTEKDPDCYEQPSTDPSEAQTGLTGCGERPIQTQNPSLQPDGMGEAAVST